jgi:putative membrane protein
MRRLPVYTLLIYAILTAYIIIGIYLGVRYQPFLTPLLTLLGFVFAVQHGSERMGWGRTLLLLGLTFAVSLLFESVGVATGKIYGPYHYTDLLGVKFLGLVPLLIPVAWFWMTYPSYVLAERIVPKRWGTWGWRLGVAAVGAMIMTAWDLAMDPMMVAGGHWVWDVEGAYFGVPLQNFWGWWLTTFVTFGLFLVLGRVSPEDRPLTEGHFDRLAVISYAITGLSTVWVVSMNGLAGPALVGTFAMLPWVLWGWGGNERMVQVAT